MSYTFCPEKDCGCLSNSCFSSFYSSSVRSWPTWSPFRLVVEGLSILAGGITITWLRFVSSLKHVTCLSATGSTYRVVRFLPNLHSSLVRFIIGTWINSLSAFQHAIWRNPFFSDSNQYCHRDLQNRIFFVGQSSLNEYWWAPRDSTSSSCRPQ